MKFHLFTTLYDEQLAPRRAELDLCLATNERVFDDVVVLAESMNRPEDFGGLWVNTDRRQRYADVLLLTQSVDRTDIVCISNADIAFTSDALEAINRSLDRQQAYALTRWDVIGDTVSLFDVPYSQDAWVFRGPPRKGLVGDYPFGVPGCDGRFAHELDAVGYRVMNPSRSIRLIHHHSSRIRHSNTLANRVPLPYLYIQPHALDELPMYQRPTKPVTMPSTWR